MTAPPIPTLTTPRLTLRAFTLEDAPRVQRLAGDVEVATTTLTIPHPYEDGVAEDWIGTHAERWASARHLTLAITTEKDGLVGAVGLQQRSPHRRAELGYWIARDFWGRGYATEAAGAVVAYGFRELGLNKIDAHYLARNPASGRVMEKVGMSREGVLRQHIVKWEEPEDVIMYGILASDFLAQGVK